MTIAARQVLADLLLVHERLEVEASGQGWRILWVSAVALARAVGHVLKNVDVVAGDAPKELVDRAFLSWKELPEHRIFRYFIELERNSVLKQYESMVLQTEIVPIVVRSSDGTLEVYDLTENLYRPIEHGAFEGEDARDVLLLAIRWWDSELKKIEDFSTRPM